MARTGTEQTKGWRHLLGERETKNICSSPVSLRPAEVSERGLRPPPLPFQLQQQEEAARGAITQEPSPLTQSLLEGSGEEGGRSRGESKT